MPTKNPALHATAANVVEYRAVHAALIRHLDILKRMTEKYPVYCTFAGVGYVFESPEEIDKMIADLHAELARYEAA